MVKGRVGLHRDKRHMYSWAEGKKFPGVTTVIKVNDDGKSDRFVKWATEATINTAVNHIDEYYKLIKAGGTKLAVDLLMKVAPTERDTAADMGTRIHTYAEMIAKKQEPPEILPSDEKKTYSYLRWMKANRPKFLHIEYMVISLAHEYGGTGDAMFYLENCPAQGCTKEEECLWSVDYKTGKGAYVTTALQLAGLHNADFIGLPDDPTMYPIPVPDHYGVLHVREDEAELIEYSVTEEEWVAFLACRAIHNWNRKRGPKIQSKTGVTSEPTSK